MPTIDDFLKYIDGVLPFDEKEEFEDFLLAEPENFSILKGLSIMKKQYGSAKRVKQILIQKKINFSIEAREINNQLEHLNESSISKDRA